MRWPASLALSIGLFTRAGALIVLPVLLLWILRQARSLHGRNRYVFLLGGTGCVAAGYLLQRALLVLIGDASGGYCRISPSCCTHSPPDRGTGARRSWLYGVETPAPVETMNQHPAVGDRQSAGAARHFPCARWQRRSLTYLAALFRLPYIDAINPWLIALFAVGAACLVLLRRRRGCQLLLLVALGEALSAPLIFDADGMRVFAATFPVRCLFVAVAVSAWDDRSRRLSGADRSATRSARSSRTRIRQNLVAPAACSERLRWP
jgi:hypothetical protein